MPSLHLTLYTRRDCSACDDAAELMRSLAAALDFDWRPYQIDDDPELQRAYGDAVPVVANSEGCVLAEAPIVPGQLARAIQAVIATPIANRPSD